TVSVWPSWQKEFSRELGTSLPNPPINVLGCCDLESAGTDYQFDPRTCWDDNKKWFADPTPGNGLFNGPENSYAYIYRKIDDGYSLCAFTEYVEEGGDDSSCDSGGSEFIKISP
ncbi:MAG TPA: hypothetical protein VKO42_04850, partial [Patescibacteria group bacterium]|nr:hypothetical protein [Patescibacteria group bacterium]